MDELGLKLDNNHSNDTNEEQLVNSSIDKGNGSVEPTNEWVTQSDTKVFDSNNFLRSVVNTMEEKNKNVGKEKSLEVIYGHNLGIIQNKGLFEGSVRKVFGYFAENTLEDLRLNSLKDKKSMDSPLMASTPNAKTTQLKTLREQSINNKQKQISNSRTLRSTRSSIQSNSSEDEVSALDLSASKQKSCSTPVLRRRLKFEPKSTADESVGSSLSPFNESIGELVKTRKRVVTTLPKQK